MKEAVIVQSAHIKYPILTTLSVFFRILAGINGLLGMGMGATTAFGRGGFLSGGAILAAGLFAAATCLLFAEMIRLALSVEQHIRATAASQGYEEGAMESF